MAAHQAPPSLGFSRQEHWSGLPFPSPMHESEKWKWSRSVMSNSSNPMDCSPPGSSIHGIFQARVLEWGAIAFSDNQPRQHIKKQRHYFVNKGPSSQGYGVSSGHVWMWKLDCEESWVPKNWCFWTVVLEKTLESPLDCKEIQTVHPKGDQSWVFIGRTDEAETPILWPPDEKSWLKIQHSKSKIMTSNSITSWQIDGETMETVTDFIFLVSKSLWMVSTEKLWQTLTAY